MIPEKANVYYAINTTHDLNFILREKTEDLSAVGGNVTAAADGNGGGSNSFLGTPRGGRSGSGALARPQRDSSKARRKLLGLIL